MRKLIFATAIAVAALASCKNETMEIIEPGHQFAVTFIGENPATRAFFDPAAAAEEWEKTLNNISVFVFTASDGKLVLRRDMTAAELSTGKVNFSLPWSAADKSLRFYAVANYAVTTPNVSEVALKALLDADCGAYNGTVDEVFMKVKRAEGFTMSAVSEVEFSGGANSVTTVEMTLRRTVAKVAMRVRVDEGFGQRYGGAAIRVTGVTVLNAEKTTTVIAPETVGAGVRDFTFTQTPNVEGDYYQSLFYLYENGQRSADEYVTLKIEALFDADGNLLTTDDQSVVEYRVRLNHADNGIVKRNSYYRIDASLQGLDGHEIEAVIRVADWDGPIEQTEKFGN